MSLILLAVGAAAVRTVELFGNSTLGYYYLEALVGTPPQRKALIFDTGSHLTIFPCAGCSQCRPHLSPLFDPAQSSSYRPIKGGEGHLDWKCSAREAGCPFFQSYTEGSLYEGVFATEAFRFAGEAVARTHVVGCAARETGEFYSQDVDGIIGFGQRSSEVHPPTPLDVEAAENPLAASLLSVCIGHEGGSLSLGGFNERTHVARNVRWIEQRSDWASQFTVPVGGVFVGDRPLDYDFAAMNARGKAMFLDSGTTFFYMNAELFAAWRAVFSDFCRQDARRCAGYAKYQECYRFDPAKHQSFDHFLWSFPNVTFYFSDPALGLADQLNSALGGGPARPVGPRSGAKWTWFSQDFIVPAMDSSDSFCVAAKPLSMSILGAVFMRNRDVLIDRSARRVGFVRAACGGARPWLDDDDLPWEERLRALDQPQKRPAPLLGGDEIAQHEKSLDGVEKLRGKIQSNTITGETGSSQLFLLTAVFFGLAVVIVIAARFAAKSGLVSPLLGR